MKKIALVYLGRSGAGPVYSIEMVRALLDQGCGILAVVSAYAENIREWRELEGQKHNLEVFAVKTYKGALGFIVGTINVFRFCRIGRRIGRFAPDVLYSTMVHPWNPIVFWMGRKAGIRIKTIHDVVPHKGEDGFFSRKLNDTEYRQATHFVVLSEIAIPIVVSHGIAREKIIHIPHAHFGVYVAGVVPRNEKVFGRFLFFGRINEYKGIPVLLEAMRAIHAVDPGLTLVIAGYGDIAPFAGAIDELSSCLDLKIRWIEQHEVSSLMNDIDFVVLPYIEATQSGVIPLAYGCRRTVVATNVGGLPEQVLDGVTGFLVPASSPEAIARAVLELYSDPGRIKRMGDAAYDYAMRELSWHGSAHRLLNGIALLSDKQAVI